MKKSTMIVTLCLSLGLAGTSAVNASGVGKTHQVATEVVSTDLKAHTITVKDDHGAAMTVVVLEPAVATMKTVKAGEKVTLTCKDDDHGGHVGVVAIKAEPHEAH